MRSFARIMLDNSMKLAGPYAIQVQQTNVAIIGDPVGLGIRVTVARNGRPLPFVPVRVASPDGKANVGTTDEDGWVRLTYEHPSAGETPLRITVAKTPETRLRILTPSQPSRSRVVVAGRKGIVQGQGAVYVKARPEVEVTHGVKRVRVGAATGGRFQLIRSAEAWPRRAVVTLHGPFAHADNVSCGDRIARKGETRVTDAGYYKLPRFKLSERGLLRLASPRAGERGEPRRHRLRGPVPGGRRLNVRKLQGWPIRRSASTVSRERWVRSRRGRAPSTGCAASA